MCIIYKNKFDEISLSASYINCEDGINLINTSGSIKNVNVNKTVLDGIDLDFSDVLIKDVKINNAGTIALIFQVVIMLLKSLNLRIVEIKVFQLVKNL